MGQETPHTPPARSAMDRSWRMQPLPASPLSDDYKDSGKGHRGWLKRQAKALARLHDAPGGAKRIAEAIRNNETITLCGDYDCDGNCSTAIMRRFLLDAGVPEDKIRVDIPNREADGYGYNTRIANAAKAAGTGLVITLDNGTKADAAIDLSLNLGMDVVVLDHHPNSPGEALPGASHTGAHRAWIINPGRADEPASNAPLKPLAAAGVTLLMVQCVHELLTDYYPTRPTANVEPSNYTGTATLATVADVVDISGPINRTLVRYGLHRINQGNDPAISAMLREAGLQGRLSSEDIAFRIAPRINAPGRLGQSISWELLSARKPEAIENVLKNIQQVFDNKSRQHIEAELVEQARVQATAQKQADIPVLFVGGEGWHEGVIGIVAGRMKEEFGRPVIAYSQLEDGTVKCSARNLKVPASQTDLGQAFRDLAHEGVLSKAGGHVMAAGASLDAKNLARFKSRLNDMLGAQTRQMIAHSHTPVAQLVAPDADLETVLREQEAHQPFGEGNPRPKVVIPNVRIMDTAQSAGPRDRHLLRLVLRDADARHPRPIHGQAFHAGGSALEGAIIHAQRRSACVLGSLNRDREGKPVLQIEDMYVPSYRASSTEMLRDMLGGEVAQQYQAQHGGARTGGR